MGAQQPMGGYRIRSASGLVRGGGAIVRAALMTRSTMGTICDTSTV